jgi:hypothetical protein
MELHTRDKIEGKAHIHAENLLGHSRRRKSDSRLKEHPAAPIFGVCYP